MAKVLSTKCHLDSSVELITVTRRHGEVVVEGRRNRRNLSQGGDSRAAMAGKLTVEFVLLKEG